MCEPGYWVIFIESNQVIEYFLLKVTWLLSIYVSEPRGLYAIMLLYIVDGMLWAFCDCVHACQSAVLTWISYIFFFFALSK